MRRVLFVYSAAEYGGMIKNLNLLLNNLSTEVFEIVILRLENSADDLSIDVEGIEEQYLSLNKALSIKKIFYLRNFIKSGNFQLISSHGYKANFYVLISSLFVRKLPKITVLHGWVGKSLKLKFYQFIDRVLIRFFDRIIVLSKQQELELKKLLLNRNKICYIPNGIAAENFLNSVRNSAKIDYQAETVFLACSRLSQEKNISLLIEFIAKLKQADLKLVVLGTGDCLEQLQQQANQLNISEQVEFAGYQKDIKPFLNSADYFLSASVAEGLPNSVMEAIAAKIPVLLSDIEPHQQLVDQNYSLFTANDSDSLLKQYKLLAEDTEIRLNQVERNYQYLCKNYSLQSRIEAYQKLYQEIINNHA